MTINDDGLFSGNTEQKGGAIYLFGNRDNAATTLIMNGGNISENTADISGGGIYATEQAEIQLKGGAISDNKAAINGMYWNGGGGICTDSSGNVLTIEGGVVSN